MEVGPLKEAPPSWRWGLSKRLHPDGGGASQRGSTLMEEGPLKEAPLSWRRGLSKGLHPHGGGASQRGSTLMEVGGVTVPMYFPLCTGPLWARGPPSGLGDPLWATGPPSGLQDPPLGYRTISAGL